MAAPINVKDESEKEVFWRLEVPFKVPLMDLEDGEYGAPEEYVEDATRQAAQKIGLELWENGFIEVAEVDSPDQHAGEFRRTEGTYRAECYMMDNAEAIQDRVYELEGEVRELRKKLEERNSQLRELKSQMPDDL